jgi:hypothetical protein
VGSKRKRELSFTHDQVPQSVLAIWPRALALAAKAETKTTAQKGYQGGELVYWNEGNRLERAADII